jgi:hypothetical protein
MTKRGELREKCLVAMATAAQTRFPGLRHADPVWLSHPDWLKICATAFDALHGIARVDPIEATEEMRKAATHYFSDPLTAFETISAAGDLTNP